MRKIISVLVLSAVLAGCSCHDKHRSCHNKKSSCKPVTEVMHKENCSK